MSQELRSFNFYGNPVRVLFTQDGPLFVAKDVADAVGYSETKIMLRFVDDEDRGVQTLDILGAPQKFSVITEWGLYTAVIRSYNPLAKVFKRWVTLEVFPSIRKNDMHVTQDTAEAIINDPDIMIKALTTMKQERIEKEAQKYFHETP